MKTEHELKVQEEQAVQPKYAVGLMVWYHANWQRVEGKIMEIRRRGTSFFYRVGNDWVPQEQTLPVEPA